MNPFFSVCIPATDREKTIYNTLQSLLVQTFDDFEVIISLCMCSDNTEMEIERFLESQEFKNEPFRYTIQKLNYSPKTVEDWNEPLKIASGKYIAMLEGDDQFMEDHLKTAFEFLNKNPKIGIYFPGSHYTKQLLSGTDVFLKLYELKAIPAPSEAIFLSASETHKFEYNVEEYNYCPEIELYFTICIKGFDVYYSGIEGVIRDRKLKSRAKWKYYKDHFYILDKFKDTSEQTQLLYRVAKKRIALRATDALIYNWFIFKSPESKELKSKLIDKIGYLLFYTNMLVSLTRIARTFLKKRLGKTESV